MNTMTYFKKHNIFFISLFILIVSTILLGFTTRGIQIDQKILNSANFLAQNGIINDNSNNPVAYKLSSKITRREMLKVMMNISGKGKAQSCKGEFEDLKSDDWGCYYAEKALELGYISPNKKFRPDDNVSKIESIKMILSAKNINVKYDSDWRKSYIEKAKELGITNDFGDYDTAGKRGWIFQNTNNLIRQEFKNENSADINFISPKGEITDLNKNITVSFSKPVVSLTALDNQEKCPITITPQLKGKCVWITTSTFQFRPNKGFPIGANYKIKIAISDTKSKYFNVKTPKFKILNTSNAYFIDKPILIGFNSEISIENFKNNFKITGFKNNELNIKYFSIEANIKGEKDINKSVISIFPKYGDWGYDKKYTYTLKGGLKSIRGNTQIGKEKIITFTTSKLLLSSSPFIYIDKNKKDYELNSNLKFSANKNIITKQNPNILFNFYQEIDLNKGYFNVKGYDFDIKYAKKRTFIDGENIIENNKKSIILTIKNTKNIENLDIIVNLSKINNISKDIKLKFNTKENNKVINYKFIDYKNSCLTLKNKIAYNINNYDKFDYQDNIKSINYINSISKYSNNKNCEYEKGKNKYLINTNLTPNKQYNLNIKKDLLDIDNYPLDNSYSTSFTTGPALNRDKNLSLIDFRNLILIPEDLKPLKIITRSINIDKIYTKICNGDFDILSENYIKNSKCIEKEVEIENLGFQNSFSTLNLQEIFNNTFSGTVITLEIGKTQGDKTEYETNNNKVITYIKTNKSIVLKTGKSGLLWITDFRTGENITNSISKIQSYKKIADYSLLGNYKGEKISYEGDISFEPLENGLYKLDKTKGILLITLKSGEQILTDPIYNGYNNEKSEVYITTSKPIYKPGETVKIKGISRIFGATGYKLNKQKQNLIITSPSHKNILNTSVILNENATFTYEYKLDKDSKLGNYNLSVGNNSVSFAVEEYEKPDFKVDSKALKAYYIYGEIPQIKISSEYYIGNKLSNQNGKYNITAKDYNFSSEKYQGYIWGEAPLFWIYNIYPNIQNNINIENNKEFELDKNGEAILNINTDKTTKNKIYTVSTTITDSNTSKTINSNSSFKLIKSNSFVGMKFDKFYYNFGDTAKIDFLNLDINENKLKKQKIIFKVYKIDYYYNKDTYNTDKKQELLYQKELFTDNLGGANIDYKIDTKGELKFEIETTNGDFKTSKTYYISGYNLLISDNSKHNIKITKDKNKYEVGENAKFIIFSPVKNAKALITIEKYNEILYKKVINIDKLTTEFILPIKSEYISNFDFKVFIVEKTKENTLANYYIGKTNIEVSKLKMQLKIDIKTNKKVYSPSEQAKIDLIIKDSNGSPVNGEALIVVTDESLFALKDNNIKIEDFFYSKQANTINTFYSLNKQIKKFDINKLKQETTNNLNPIIMQEGNIGMGAMLFKGAPVAMQADSLSMSTKTLIPSLNSNKTHIRSDFKDLAYYKAVVKVVNGKASINIDKLPDNLTTWVVSGYLISKDNKIGSFKKKFKVQKELNLLPSIPRFFIYGDTLEITATIINNSSKNINITSNLEITNAQIISKPKIKTIDKNSDELLVWKVKINENFKENNISNIKISVNSETLSDSIQLSRKIIDYSIPEYTFTNGSTYSGSYEDKIFLPKEINQSKGQIEISIGASILTNLTKNIDNSFENYFSYNNFYSIIGMFKKAGALKNLYKEIGEIEKYNNIKIKNYNNKKISLNTFIKNKIKDISFYQNSDGAMMTYKDCKANYFKQTCSNFNLTGEFLSAVKDLEKAGYKIDKNIINKALNYYKKELEKNIKKYEQHGDKYRNVDSFYKILDYDKKFLQKYILSPRFNGNDFNFDNISKLKLILILKNIDPHNKQINTYLKELENSTKIEARGTLLSSNNNIISTALALRVFIPHPNPPLTGEGTQKLDKKLIIENMTRWLISQNNRKGNFGSNYYSSEIIKSITKYIKYTGELKGINFEAKGFLNGKEIINNKFDNTNKFSIKNDSFKLKDYLQFGENNPLRFEKTGTGKLYYDVGLRYFLPISQIKTRDEGIIVKRDYYNYNKYKESFKKECIKPMWFGGYYRGYSSKISTIPGGYCNNIKIKNIDPVKSGNKGDFLVGVIELIIPSERNNIIVNNYIPAGSEIVNINLNTTSDDIKNISGNNRSNYWNPSFSHIETRDEKLVLFADKLNAGTYKYSYVLKLNHKGKYHNRPAVAEELKKPEIFGRTKGGWFEIK